MKSSDWAEDPQEFAAMIEETIKAFYDLEYSKFCAESRGFEADVVRPVATEAGELDEVKFLEFVEVIEAWTSHKKRTDLLGYCRALMSACYGASLSAKEMTSASSPAYLRALRDGAYYWGLLEQGSWEEKLRQARHAVSLAASSYNEMESLFYEWCREQDREGDFEKEIVRPISDSAGKFGLNEPEWKKVWALADEIQQGELTPEASFQAVTAHMTIVVGCCLLAETGLREGFVETAYDFAESGRTYSAMLAGRSWGVRHERMKGVGLREHLRKATDASTARYRTQRDQIYAWCSNHLESFRRQHAHRAVKEAAKAILEQRVAALELEVVCRHIRAFQGRQIELRQL
jgi:hypothetical protein